MSEPDKNVDYGCSSNVENKDAADQKTYKIKSRFGLEFLVRFVFIFGCSWLVMSFLHPFYNPDLDMTGSYILILIGSCSAWFAYKQTD